MNYELAKELKDAGFIQGKKIIDLTTKIDRGDVKFFPSQNTRNIYINCKNQRIHPSVPLTDDCVLVPTLSELIEACGDSFRHLTLHHLSPKKPHFMKKHGKDVVWSAHSCAHFVSKKLKGKVFRGKTPEEAVARLWLALNTK